MYDYYKGYIIREENDGIDGAKLRELYEAVGWCGSALPAWQNEKFEIAMKNSAGAFTAWDKDALIGMARVVSDKVMAASIQDLIIPENYDFYKKCGFSMPEETNATMEYNGFPVLRL